LSYGITCCFFSFSWNTTHSGLGGNTYPVVQLALENGFRKFDTAEADLWYDQAEVGRSLQDYFSATTTGSNDNDRISDCTSLQISTKIPPWSLTSAADIRNHAANSRQELLGFCDVVYQNENQGQQPPHHSLAVFPLDVYYIHLPRCWSGTWRSFLFVSEFYRKITLKASFLQKIVRSLNNCYSFSSVWI
jgi:diketogulonate reductase-like aldo/keto reductase